jgi:beta-galactosidase/beta-glucuronidase
VTQDQLATQAELHPTPQTARRRWLELSGSWAFDYDDADTGIADGWTSREHRLSREIQVPYPPESELSGIGDTGFHRVLWYQRTFSREAVAEAASYHGDDARLILHFGAVDHACAVYLNGSLAGEHVGGMTPFRLDLTDLLADGQDEQMITLRVTDDPHDLAQPRGKQDWRLETQGIFYERTSGIWQPVWLEQVAPIHVVDLAWTTDLVANRVTAEIELSRIAPDTRISLRLDDQDTVIGDLTTAATGTTVTCSIELSASDRRPLWSPEHPNLIDAAVEVQAGGQTVDEVQSYLGLRSVGIRDGQFLLNGHPYYLRSVLEQGYWPQSQLTAPSPEALRREVELIKELGFNTARIHQKVEDPRFLYWCDKLGLAVWGEMANAFVFSTRSMNLLVTEWLDVVRRDRSHPSILAWVPINESWGVSKIAESEQQQHFASTMYHLTKALDPTRPTMSNEGWEHTESDIWGVHDYSPDAEGIRHRYSDAEIGRTLTDRGPGRRKVLLGSATNTGQPIMITEFGGLSFKPRSDERWFGYSTIETAEEFLDQLRALVGAITDSPAVAGFCYTQLTDTGQETNGLLRGDRSAKLQIEAVHDIITTPSRAIAAEEVDRSRREARSQS